MTDRSEEIPLFIASSEVEIRISDDRSQIWVRFGKPHSSLGFDPNIVLAMSLSPDEALRLASALAKTAREAQASQSH